MQIEKTRRNVRQNLKTRISSAAWLIFSIMMTALSSGFAYAYVTQKNTTHAAYCIAGAVFFGLVAIGLIIGMAVGEFIEFIGGE